MTAAPRKAYDDAEVGIHGFSCPVAIHTYRSWRRKHWRSRIVHAAAKQWRP